MCHGFIYDEFDACCSVKLLLSVPAACDGLNDKLNACYSVRQSPAYRGSNGSNGSNSFLTGMAHN